MFLRSSLDTPHGVTTIVSLMPDELRLKNAKEFGVPEEDILILEWVSPSGPVWASYLLAEHTSKVLSRKAHIRMMLETLNRAEELYDDY